ncbi:MAG: hypothetical protein U5L96_10355 [Owenweeksia sp.]|nr:hypothetical protein [Owenweeksia sp.]
MVLLLAAAHISCKKEVVHQYEIEEVTLYTSASEKKNLKTDEQFIAILYTDTSSAKALATRTKKSSIAPIPQWAINLW